MRLRRLARWLVEADAAEVVTQLEHTAAHTRDGPLYRQLYVTLAQLVLHIRPRPTLPGGPLPMPDRQWLLSDLRLAMLIGAATREACPFVARLLRDAFGPPNEADAQMLTLHPSVEKLPLGVRRERARLADREGLNLLTQDSTPAVVVLLADNPRVVETQALQIASLRPTHPYALQALLLSLRWLTNERVAEAVIRNHAAPGWLVQLLAPLVPRKVQLAVPHLVWLDLALRNLLAEWAGIAGERTVGQAGTGEAQGHLSWMVDPAEVDADAAEVAETAAAESPTPAAAQDATVSPAPDGPEA
jgi:hypothetical protein